MPVWYSKPRFSTGSTVTVSPGIAPARPSSTAPSRSRSAAPAPAARAGRAPRGSPPRRTGRRDQARQQGSCLARRCRHRGDILVVERVAQRRGALAGDAEASAIAGTSVGRVSRPTNAARPAAASASPATAIASTSAAVPSAPISSAPTWPTCRSGRISRAFDPQHLAGIAEAQRPRRMRQPGGGDARDLRRHVGAHPDHALRDRVHQAEGLGSPSRRRRRTAASPRIRPAAA